MNVLGVKLHTPTAGGITTAAIRLGIAIAVVASLHAVGSVSKDLALGLLAGVAGTELAIASGCTIDENGLRGGLVSALFAVVMAGVCRLFIAITS